MTASNAANVRELPPRPDAQPEAAGAGEEAPRPGILRLTPIGEDEKEQREVAFYIGDKAYTALKHPPAGMAMRYIEVGVTAGPTPADAWLLRVMLGDDGYDALVNYPKLTAAQLRDVLKTCRDKVTGALKDPKEQP